MVKKMKIPLNDIKQYANAVSKEIFRKPFCDLAKHQVAVLRLSLIVRLNSDEIDQDTYRQIDTHIKRYVQPEEVK